MASHMTNIFSYFYRALNTSWDQMYRKSSIYHTGCNIYFKPTWLWYLMLTFYFQISFQTEFKLSVLNRISRTGQCISCRQVLTSTVSYLVYLPSTRRVPEMQQVLCLTTEIDGNTTPEYKTIFFTRPRDPLRYSNDMEECPNNHLL
jgi:hypothetical protein